MTYREEADALDGEILQCIEQRRVPNFDDLALRIFAHQLRYNRPYSQYCAARGITVSNLPSAWDRIVPVPSGAFKEAALCTFDTARAALAFETSGTSTGTGGKHYMETSALYDAALSAGFYDAMLTGDAGPLRYLLLVPNPAERPQSSLGYMMGHVSQTYGDGREEWFLQSDMLHVDRFVDAAKRAAADGVSVCVTGTAFAFVQLLDALRELGIEALPLPQGSRVMETGGFKGRSRIVERADLYRELSAIFDLPDERIVAEYGMTELTSQYYDRTACHAEPVPESRGDSVLSEPKGRPSRVEDSLRVKVAPPWLRPRVVGPDGKTLPNGIVGALVHVDLANRSSCVALQTEDLGVATDDGGIILIGRERGADLRGCSLDAERLQTPAAHM